MGTDHREQRSGDITLDRPYAEPVSSCETGSRRTSLEIFQANPASFIADSFRFLVAGGLNTLLTLGLYQLLIFALSPHLAYAVSWLAGIIFVIKVYPDRVFPGGRSDTKARIKLGLSYLGVFLLGLAILHLSCSLGVDARLAILIVICATTTTNIVVGRLLLRR